MSIALLSLWLTPCSIKPQAHSFSAKTRGIRSTSRIWADFRNCPGEKGNSCFRDQVMHFWKGMDILPPSKYTSLSPPILSTYFTEPFLSSSLSLFPISHTTCVLTSLWWRRGRWLFQRIPTCAKPSCGKQKLSPWWRWTEQALPGRTVGCCIFSSHQSYRWP